ncbi:Similar to Pre-mRNA-processing protein prp40; acc. no. O14176 [Pyronema omphalodes CBS 100304]|uniref:Similar to Pre-mRNA-processing protein prp40 acc. no. O14176 n=1 Tax=Pyronema omphalodes (strain CBS 100304) TaxID=1076935 RepID=U4LQV3_PYROM|nr:Similar to Pre-mRNA-processing protein prp40; acc. no. O14176 [Pyronema omphalodes CBS 100304]
MSSVWQETKTQDGKVYYYNVQTKATQWTKPVELMSPAERTLQDLPWKEHKAADGRPYWYHAQTRETTWTMPPEFRDAVDRVNEQASNGLPPMPAFVAGGTQQFGQPQNNERALAIPGQMMEAASDGTARPMHISSSLSNDRNEPQYSSYDEAESAFVKLLRRNNVGADWTWEKTLRAIIKEPQYRALKDPKDRKAAFDKYIVELKQQEQEKAKDRIAKLRQDFSVMLKSHPEIKFYTRWKTARKIIEGETIFRSTSNEDERRQLFDEYILELQKAEHDRETKARKEAVDDLVGLLKSLEMEPYTRWSEAQTIIHQNEHFQSEEKFQALSKLDVLNAFENHIKFLEREFNDKRQRLKTMKNRKERKNREAFVGLLNELRTKGDIRAGTKWKQVYPLIKDDERYQNMLGQGGSTPLDLFWDMIEDLERGLRSKRNVVQDVMDEKRFDITESTSFQEFTDFLKKDSRTAQFDQDTATLLFEKLREKIVRRLEDDRHQQERHQRRRVDALRSVIRHLEPPVEVTDTYDKIKPRIEKSEEYKALDSDELRQAAFDKHIRRLKEKAEERDRERERKDREKEKERDRRDRRTPRDESRNGYDSYHKPRHSRHDRDRSRHGTRTPEPDAYEAERRRAAGERERQYRRRDSSVRGSERGSRPDSRHRRDERDRTESVYDRERRERDEERERQYTRPRGDGEERRDRDEYRPRRRRGLTPEDDERDIKRSRHERTPRPRTPPPRERIFDDTAPLINYGEDPMMDYGKDPVAVEKPRRASKAAKPKESGKTEEKSAAPKEEEKKAEAKPKAEKMDVDNKGEESEEGEIAE